LFVFKIIGELIFEKIYIELFSVVLKNLGENVEDAANKGRGDLT